MEPKHQRGLLAPRQPRKRVEEFVMLGDRGFGCWHWVSSHDGLVAMNVATRVDDDGAQVRRRVEHGRPSRLQANERVLHDLLGGRPRAGQQVRDSHERRPLPFVQFSDPRPVAGTPWLSVGSHHTMSDGSEARSVARRSQLMSHCRLQRRPATHNATCFAERRDFVTVPTRSSDCAHPTDLGTGRCDPDAPACPVDPTGWHADGCQG